MQRHVGYARGRVEQAVQKVRRLVYPEVVPIGDLALAGPVGHIRAAEAETLDYEPVETGAILPPRWETYWLRVRAEVPQAFAGSRVDLRFDFGGEATIWRSRRLLQGLNGGDYQPRREAVLLDRADGGERLELLLELACREGVSLGLPGDLAEPARLTGGGFVLDRCELARFDDEAWRLFHDLTVLQELEREREHGLDPVRAGRILAGLDTFCDRFRAEDRSTWTSARELLAPLLGAGNAAGAHRQIAMGHAHLDTAWLWPLAESRRKALRTFSIQLALMERYPEHRFVCSQPQHYAWVNERDPGLYREILKRVEGGQWLPVGGMWIEPDCNLTSGESLVRQLLHGQAFFERELGGRTRELWLPDVFGYCGQLPQLMAQSGLRGFVSQKLSWGNQYTLPEHHTFVWEGLDGTRVLAHFPPAETYNAETSVRELRHAMENYRDHDGPQASLLIFGYGDGGGGPNATMLERLRRFRDLQGVPPTELGHPQLLFDELETVRESLPVHVGELYFEYHRGTYTSQAALKRGNRRCEGALHDGELLAALAAWLRGAPYPREQLDEAWKTLLTTQFHDILPGSSITPVNVEAREDLARVEAAAEAIVADALGALGGSGHWPRRFGQWPDGPEGPLNTTAWPRREVVTVGDELRIADAPPYGVGAFVEPSDAVELERLEGGGVRVRNGQLEAVLSPGGSLLSLVERASGREALAAPANVLELYQDQPNAWDAWDVDPYHVKLGAPCPPADGIASVVATPLRAEVRFERPVGQRSQLTQTVRLDAHGRRLEFHTEVEWHEEHRLLKAVFPLAVRSRLATYETAFGVEQRPTHANTSADAARFEVSAHRFADLSEDGFGVALLTDSKYGYSCRGGVLRVSLLRSPKAPDPEADMGRHTFVYAVLPHAGGWQDGGVLAEATALNRPLRLAGLSPVALVEVDGRGLVLDTVKLAESSDALVLRLYEAFGGRGTARVRLGIPFGDVRRATLLEDPGERIARDGDAFHVSYRPFEVITLLVQPANHPDVR